MKSKMFKAKIKAQQGYQLNPWEMQQSPYQYPQQYQPIEMSDYGNQQIPISGYNNPAPMNQMEVQPMQYNTTSQASQNQSNDRGQQIGSMAAGFGRMAGQALNAAMVAGPQLINAMLPEQDLRREDNTLQRANTRYPQGTGSQAIYRNGGKMKQSSKDVFTPLSDEEAAYYYMNNIPLPKETDYNQDYVQPAPTSPYANFTPQPVNIPEPYQPRNISYNRMSDVTGQPTAYLPQFDNYSYNEAQQALTQLPEYIDNIPVVRSNYQDFFQGFYPNSQSNQWSPYDYGDYNPQPLTSFKCGGKMKGMKNGGYMPGQEIELTAKQVKDLLSQGFELDIL